MSNPFDATLKDLLESSPLDWPRLFGYPATHAEVIDSDISTISGAADKVIKVRGKPDWIHHLDFQAGPDALKPRKLNVYNSVLEDRHNCPVRSGLVLLSQRANLKIYTGIYESRISPEAEPYRIFRYDVIRVWELEPQLLLSGSINLLPLLPLAKIKTEAVPEILDEIKRRVDQLKDEHRARVIWSATDKLMGLRFDDEFITRVLKGVLGMKHSTYFQSILDEGEARGLRRSILLLGESRLGPANELTRQQIEATTDLVMLRTWFDKAVSAESWDDLLPTSKKPSRKKKPSGK